ncbi:MAG: hypothetical protein V4558_15385 [Gemmatimonadota bacterium]
MALFLRAGRAFALLLLVAASGATAHLSAQRADSADAARKFYRDSRLAFGRGDTAAAFQGAVATAAAWPRQGSYVRYLARVAAATGHPDAALDALDIVTEMGFDWTPADSGWGALAALPRFQALSRRALEALAPITASSVSVTLPPSFHHAEGVAFDPRTGRRFVSSIRLRKVVAVDATGNVSDFIGMAEPKLYAVFGMAADAAQRVLWLTTSAMKEQEGGTGADSGKSELRAYHLDSGIMLGRWKLPATEPHCLGDVILAPNGAAYASDSCQPHIYRATLEGGMTSIAATHRDWRNLQGIAFSPTGCTAWVADWTTGLYRIDLGSNTVTAVRADPRLVTLGLDGLYWAGTGRLIAIQNGVTPTRVVELSLNDDGTAVEALRVLDRPGGEAEPSLGVVLSGALLYVANTSWNNYNGEGTPQGAFEPQMLRKLPVPGLAPATKLAKAPRC